MSSYFPQNNISDTTTSTTLYNTSNSSYAKQTSSSKFTNSVFNTNREAIPGGVSYSFTPTWVPVANVVDRIQAHSSVEEQKPIVMNRMENSDPNRGQFQKPFTFHYDKTTDTSDLYFPLYVNEITTVNITNNNIVDCSTGKCRCLDDCSSKCKKQVCFNDSDSSSSDSECSCDEVKINKNSKKKSSTKFLVK